MRGARLTVPVLAAAIVMAAVVMTAPPVNAQVTISGTIRYWDPIAESYEPARRVDVRVKGDWWFANPRTETDDQGMYAVQVDDPKGLKKQFHNVRVEAFAQTRGIVQVFAYMLAPKPYSAVSPGIDGVMAGQSWTRDLWIGGPTNNGIVPSPSVLPVVSIDATSAAFVIHGEMQEHRRDLRSRAFTADDFDERGGDRVGGVEVIVPAVGITSYYNTTTGFVNLIPGGGDWPGIEAIGDHPFLNPSVSLFLATVRHEYSHAIHDEMTGGGILTGLTLPSNHGPDRESPYPALAYTEGFAEFLPLVSLGQGGSYEPTNEGEGGLPIPVASPPGTHHEWEGEFTAFLWDLFDPTGIETVRHQARTAENDGSSVPQEVVDGQEWMDMIEEPDVSRIRRAVRDPMPGGHIPQRVREYLANYARLSGRQDLYAIKTIAFNRDLLIPGVEESPARLEGMEMDHLRRLSCRFEVIEPDEEDRASIRIVAWFESKAGDLEQILDREIATGWRGDRREVMTTFDVAGRGGEGERLWVLVNDGMLPTVYGFDVPAADQEKLAELLEGIVSDPLPGRFEPGVVSEGRQPVVTPEDLRPPAERPFRIRNLEIGPVCRDRQLVAERRKNGQPPSDRICEARDVLVRGEDICVWSGQRKPCTWWGYEFDFENADPSVPLVCTWTRSSPGDEGNWEGIRHKDAATGSSETWLETESGHFFGPGYEILNTANPVPWHVVDVDYECTYRGEPAFRAGVRVIQSSAFGQ